MTRKSKQIANFTNNAKRLLNTFSPFLRMHRRSIMAVCGLVTVVCLSAVVAQAQSSDPGELTKVPERLTDFIYNKLRWPVCALAITASFGVAKYHPNGRNLALGILGGTFLWSMAPSIIALIKQVTG